MFGIYLGPPLDHIGEKSRYIGAMASNWNWIWQGAVSRIIWATLGAGATSAITRVKTPEWRSKWLPSVKYGVGTFVAIIVVFTCLTIWSHLRNTPPIDADNIEQVVHSWMEEWGYSVRKVTPTPPDEDFLYFATLPSGKLMGC
jgi:hypothetical protein